MKAFRIVLALAILVTMLGVGVNSALAFQFSYISGFQVQNIDPNNDATVQIEFFDSNGNQPAGSSISDTITKGSSKTYFPLNNLPNGFTGSVVVSSSTKVASVVNILGTGLFNGGKPAGASYVGSSGGNSTVLLPLLMKGNSGYNTWFSVQNTGGSATDVNVTYSDGTSNSVTGLAPGASHLFDQTTETHNAKVFSASVNSPTGVPLAAAVVEENSLIMFAYVGVAGGSTNVVMPLINANNGGYQTGAQILNAGSTDTTVTVTYTPTDSTSQPACTETQPIPHGTSTTFAFLSFTGNPIPNGGSTTCIGGQKMVGSAQVTTNSAAQPLVAIVNQLKTGVNGEAYNAFDPASAASTVVLPLIMDRNSNWFTGFSVMNVGTSATVNCTFTNNSYTVSKSLDTNQSFVDLQINKLGLKYVGSATCTATTGGKLVATVNELNQVAAGANLLVYEGIPAAP